MKKWKSLGGFHLKIAISQNKDERLCKEHELEGVSSLILDYKAVRMNADGLYLSRLSNGLMGSFFKKQTRAMIWE